MRQYRPDAAELARTVARFLKSLEPKLDEGDRYQALVCGHLLGILSRELEAVALPDEDEAALAAAIRSGARDANWDATFEAVLARTIERVRVAKPDHLAPEHR
ncbi:MAG: hypothetical protein NW206_03875 [Hyphomonadaceae bacterium]|nr:hypothetical protein [Hyphomonadaceae bacterium]